MAKAVCVSAVRYSYCFRRARFTTMDGIRTPASGITSVGLFPPRAYWQEWLTRRHLAQTGFFPPDERQPHFSELFGQIISAGQGEGSF